MDAPLAEFEVAQNRAPQLRWPGNKAPDAPHLSEIGFLKEVTPARTSADFRCGFSARREGTEWRAGEPVDFSMPSAVRFDGALKSNYRVDEIVLLDTADGKERTRHLVSEMQRYIALVEAERKSQTASAVASRGSVPGAAMVSANSPTVSRGSFAPDASAMPTPPPVPLPVVAATPFRGSSITFATPQPPPSVSSGAALAQRLAVADRRLNEVYAQARDRLDEHGKNTLKQDEIQWLKRMDVYPRTDPRRAEMIEQRIEELLRWR